MYIALFIFLVVIAAALWFFNPKAPEAGEVDIYGMQKQDDFKWYRIIRKPLVFLFGFLALLPLTNGAFRYNDSGFCQHIQTVFGSESYVCNVGWYFNGWGTSTAWPYEITVANSTDADVEGTNIGLPYKVRLADNWNGTITQTTRFSIPQDESSFMKMHKRFRTPESLTTKVLRPAVRASMDSVSNLFTMEQYWAGGQRDEFKTEFRDTITLGRAQVKQVSQENQNTKAKVSKVAPSDSENAQDTSDVGETGIQVVIMEKVLDEAGQVIREQHDYYNYGITVSAAILENLDPDDRFEQQIEERQNAASRRIVAREQRKEQEEQRLLAIQSGETRIAKEQADAKVVQIKKTTDAETSKKLALIEQERMKEAAKIAEETAAINLARAKLDAQTKERLADAEAYERQVVMEADGALSQKLDALVKINQTWATAASKINVPQTVMGGSTLDGNAVSTTDQFMQILGVKAAKDLNLDMTVK